MRHSFATLYLDAGGSLSDLQEVMGHADPRTTRRYDRERQARRQSPGDLVAAYLSARPRQRMGVRSVLPGQHSLADVGRGAVGDAQELGVGGGEDGVRVAARRPDLVVLVQPGVH